VLESRPWYESIKCRGYQFGVASVYRSASTPHSARCSPVFPQATLQCQRTPGYGVTNMADPLSVTAALIAIVTAAIQSSKILSDTVASFQNHQRHVKQLQDELSGLRGVLDSLRELAEHDQPVYEPLRVPLFQCHRACLEFEVLMATCARRSGRARTSFRDWARVRYMGGGIAEFTSMLAGYKSTISVALLDATL
jgi:hypothetical protein